MYVHMYMYMLDTFLNSFFPLFLQTITISSFLSPTCRGNASTIHDVSVITLCNVCSLCTCAFTSNIRVEFLSPNILQVNNAYQCTCIMYVRHQLLTQTLKSSNHFKMVQVRTGQTDYRGLIHVVMTRSIAYHRFIV